MQRVLQGFPIQISKYQEVMKKTQENRDCCQRVFLRLIVQRYKVLMQGQEEKHEGDNEQSWSMNEHMNGETVETSNDGLVDQMILEFCSENRDVGGHQDIRIKSFL